MTSAHQLLWAGLFALAPLSSAQNQPAAQAPVESGDPVTEAETVEPSFVARELLVLQSDRYDTSANNPAMVRTTLFPPITHLGRAKRTGPNGKHDYSPMPLGLITFEGEPSEPIDLRLSLANGSNTFHAHWPGGTSSSKRRIHWPKLPPAEQADRAWPTNPSQDWLAPLRESEDRLWVRVPARKNVYYKERFLIYDTSFRFEPALTLNLDNGDYTVGSQVPERAAPPMTVMLRKADAGWVANELPAPWPQPTVPIAEKLKPDQAGVPLDESLAPIADLLATRGYNAQEIELALRMIGSAGLDASEMSLVYVLPVGVIDETIQLRLKPEPDELIRTTIVVVNNVDPDMGSRIDALIADLADDRWSVRERAQQQLLTRGQAAIKKIQQIKDSGDPEVAFRARQILEAYDLKRDVNQ